MLAVSIDHVSKSYEGKDAVRDVSFTVPAGRVLALLGPNGAGKTSLIRMMMGITEPDSGTITFEGKARTADLPNRIGYLPEERGLYRKQRVMEVLEYFAALKGVGAVDARRRALGHLERFDLADCADKKVEALSKGMQQKVQLIATLLHEPELIVLDEPMSGLDPVNTRLVKDAIREQCAAGRAVILSTHQMFHAETLADDVVMINHGRVVLDGAIGDVRRQYSEDAVIVDAATNVDGLPCVDSVAPLGEHLKVRLRLGKSPRDLMGDLGSHGRDCQRFEVAMTPLEDIFIQIVKEDRR